VSGSEPVVPAGEMVKIKTLRAEPPDSERSTDTIETVGLKFYRALLSLGR